MKGKKNKKNSTKLLRKTDDFENQGFHNEMTKRNIFLMKLYELYSMKKKKKIKLPVKSVVMLMKYFSMCCSETDFNKVKS